MEYYFCGLSPGLSFGDHCFVSNCCYCVIVLFALLFKFVRFVQVLETASDSYFLVVVSLSQFPLECVCSVTGVLVGPVLVCPSAAW